ncbi:uncharacterized protein LOC105286680 isoform X2 [Ooceraea biroi]|uniref:uncharacterized protein LOC105286680 isoform X2 n=1 Tax=Ooceraea biroi TaxID=2015173 RepID=UPI00097172C5|nr:uncharacterized protein LOC105286680 isoform X2 [Ooceraea biroi]XP_019889616.1 uncharacterized protein LOC105286680 isoform X2 [Ooceraea biroi]
MDDSNYSGRKDFEWAVQLNRASLHLLGIWPNPEENPKKKLMSNIRVFVTFVLVISLLVPSIHSLIKIRSDIMMTIDNLQYTLPVLSAIIRLAIFWWRKEVLMPIMNMVMEDWLKSKTIYERNTMIKWALRERIIITITYLIIMMVIILLFGMSIFGKSMRLTSNITDSYRSLPVQTYYIYDVTKRPQYELTIISQYISLIIAAMLYTGIDNFFGLLVFHICGQLDIMRYRLKHSHQKFRAILRCSVMYHLRLLRTIDTIENIYNVILLILFLYFAILFAFCGFLLVTVFEDEKNDISFTRLSLSFLIILALLFHMGIYCAVGEALISKICIYDTDIIIVAYIIYVYLPYYVYRVQLFE